MSLSALTEQVPELTRARTFAMALCAGIAVANIYYNQPLLGMIEAHYPNSSVIGLIPTATQFGYAVGLLFLVPLGDLFERRRLITVQFVVLAVALAFAALAPSTLALIAASLTLGVAATVAQQIVPFAATLADNRTRGAAVGTVVSGILGGILLSRTIAGFVGAHFGWREMFWLGAPLALGAAALVRLILATAPSDTQHRLHRGPALADPSSRRGAGASPGRSDAGHAVRLVHRVLDRPVPPSPGAGIWTRSRDRRPVWSDRCVRYLGGALAGRVADKRGPHLVIAIAAAMTLSSWAVFAGWNSLAGLTVGVVLLRCGRERRARLQSAPDIRRSVRGTEQAEHRFHDRDVRRRLPRIAGCELGLRAYVVARRVRLWRRACGGGPAAAAADRFRSERRCSPSLKPISERRT